MKLFAALLASLSIACAAPSASAAPAAAAAVPSASAAPPAPPLPSPTSIDDFADVKPTAQKTSSGGDVFAVGVPRFMLVQQRGFGQLVLRSRAGLVFAEDGRWISIWDAKTGAPLRHIPPRVDAAQDPEPSLAVSADAEWIAVGSSYKVNVLRRPFEKPATELACYDALAFSADGKFLACITKTFAVWDLAKRQSITPPPQTAPKEWAHAAVFASDNRSVAWATDHALYRWDFAAGSATAMVYQAPARIDHVSFSEGGGLAYVLAANKAVVVDLSTGKTSAAPAQFGTAISPSGHRLAAMNRSGVLEVTETATGKPLWSTKPSTPVTRIAFGENDSALVYMEASQLRVATLPAPPAPLAPPSRFVGWLADGVAAIEHGPVLRAYTLATRTWAAADPTALVAKPLDGAPPWARWVVDASSERAIAAEPSKRHELDVDARNSAPCDPKLRVWTKVGGPKTLTMPCSKNEMDGHEEPGWYLGGGWGVGLSATTATIYDPRTGRRVATLNAPTRKNAHREYAPAYWHAALAPNGEWLALVWRRAQLEGSQIPGEPDPRQDAMHLDEAEYNVGCVNGDDHGCQLEYFVELWSLKGPPKRVWQERLERAVPGRALRSPAELSGPIMFNAASTNLVLAFTDGDIRSIPIKSPSAAHVEHFHRAYVRTLALDPSGIWVFSGDDAGEQRIWRALSSQ